MSRIVYYPDQQMHNICCAFVGLDKKKLYKMHGAYIKILTKCAMM